MKEKLLAIAEQYQLDEFQRQIKEILALNSIKIAFLGAFSAGKTSLINALLGLKLPVSIKPTTKSICLIEPDESIETNKYFEDCGLERKDILFTDFQDILNGERDGIAGIRVRPSNLLPLGSAFIDTPGIDNTGSSEGDLTTAYLQFVDAAIVCIDVNSGTITNHILQYLQRPELSLVREKMVFVLTHADPEKGDGAYNRVIQEVAKQIEKGLQISNAIDKVIAVDSHKPGVTEKIESLLQKNILAKRDAIVEKRIEDNLRKIALEMQNALKSIKDNLKLDDDGVDKKIANVRKIIEDLEKEKYKHRNDMGNLEDELMIAIVKQMKSYSGSFATMAIDQIESQAQTMMDSINETSQNIVNRYIRNVSLNKSLTNIGMGDVVANFKSIDSIKSMAVTVGTGIACAYIGPAAGIGNAVEAVGGGIAQNVAKAGAKEGMKEAAKEGMKEAAKEGMKEAAKEGMKKTAKKVGKKALLGKVLQSLAKAIDKANPIEQIGSVIATKVKQSNYEGLIAIKAKNIAQVIVASVQLSFEEQVLTPIANQLDLQMNSLEQLKSQRKNKEYDFQKQENKLDSAIKELASFC